MLLATMPVRRVRDGPIVGFIAGLHAHLLRSPCFSDLQFRAFLLDMRLALQPEAPGSPSVYFSARLANEERLWPLAMVTAASVLLTRKTGCGGGTQPRVMCWGGVVIVPDYSSARPMRMRQAANWQTLWAILVWTSGGILPPV